MRLFRVLLCLAVASVIGCTDQAPPFKAKPIADNPTATDFTLTDQFGQKRSLSDFRGKVVSLFFGFTHCPDICPTHLARQAEVMRQVGPKSGEVAVLFVTLDPERDTTAALKAYMDAFNPEFIALTGTETETASIARKYKIFWQKTPLPGSALVYTIDHTTNSFLIDRQGRLRLVVPHEMSAQDVTHDINLLLSKP